MKIWSLHSHDIEVRASDIHEQLFTWLTWKRKLLPSRRKRASTSYGPLGTERVTQSKPPCQFTKWVQEKLYSQKEASNSLIHRIRSWNIQEWAIEEITRWLLQAPVAFTDDPPFTALVGRRVVRYSPATRPVACLWIDSSTAADTEWWIVGKLC